MDYQRIYTAFVADRKAKEPSLLVSGEYVERHHVTPRSLKGTDAPDNIVALTAEDHIHAHILLAKIHGGRMWSALALLGKKYVGRGRKKMCWIKKQRTLVANARKLAAKNAPTGEASPMYGRKMSEASRLKMSKAHKLRAEQGLIFLQRNPDHVSGDNHWTRKVDPEKRAKVVKTAIENFAKAAEVNRGDGNPMHRQEVKAKISEATKVHWQNGTGSASPEARKKFLESRKTEQYLAGARERVLGEKNPGFGKTKEKNPNARKVRCVETGQVFNSAKAAAEWCGVEVNRACSMGIRAGGYHWERVGEQSPMVKIVPPRDRETGYAKRRRPILCVDTGEVFECAREVCEVLGTTNISTIHNAAAGRSKTAHGYRWAYA
jgi:hypothetical protein